VLADDGAGRTLTLSSYVQSSGTTEVNRGNLGGNLQILGGLLTGTNYIHGSVQNAANVSPGKPFGFLAITGNYTNLVSGFETMPIGGLSAYPQVRVSGTAYLSGTLSVTLTNGFYPFVGNTFTAMTYTARSGAFDQVFLPLNYEFEVIYTPTELLLRASNALPNVSLTVAGGVSTQYVCQPFSILASGTDLDGTITNLTVWMNGLWIGTVNGPSLQTQAEIDVPTSLQFVARAVDDRGGSRSVTQAIHTVTGPLHNLLLGGVRTNTFKICMLGEMGRSYDVLASTNLTTTNWLFIGTMEHTNGIWRYFDTQVTNHSKRYYRARQVP
jgi:hypothetical protein